MPIGEGVHVECLTELQDIFARPLCWLVRPKSQYKMCTPLKTLQRHYGCDAVPLLGARACNAIEEVASLWLWLELAEPLNVSEMSWRFGIFLKDGAMGRL